MVSFACTPAAAASGGLRPQCADQALPHEIDAAHLAHRRYRRPAPRAPVQDEIGAPCPASRTKLAPAPRPRAPEPSAALVRLIPSYLSGFRCIYVRLQLWVPARGTTVEQHVCSACGAPALRAAY